MEFFSEWQRIGGTPASASEPSPRSGTRSGAPPTNGSDPSPGSSSASPANGSKPKATSRPRTERFLYVIGSGLPGSPVKVGVAAKVASRLRNLRAGNPSPLKELFSVELSPEIVRKAEGACHRQLKELRAFGEWFNVSVEVAISVVHEVVEGRLWERRENKPRKSREQRSNVKTANVSLAVKPSLKQALRELATADDVTLSKWIERAIKAEIERRRRLS